MARRRRPAEPVAEGMPAELRRRPSTPEEIAVWVGNETMPDYWAFGSLWWRQITAYSNWSHARNEWRRKNDPTSWWYQRDHAMGPGEIGKDFNG